MNKHKKFEEMEVWQSARELANAIYKITNRHPFSKDFGLRDQIRRASVSIMSNVAEGSERDGTAEFVQFLSIAKGSAAEIKSQLYLAQDQEYLAQTEFKNLNKLVESIGRQLGAFIKYLKASGYKGIKYNKSS